MRWRNMKYEKLILTVILCVFVGGMVMGPATASHTIKCGKYKATISDKKWKSLKKSKGIIGYTVKTKNTYTVKKPKYKTKKVKEWKRIKVLDSKWVTHKNGDSSYHDYRTMKKYVKKGWTWTGSSDKNIDYYDGSSVSYHYLKFKKKVTVNKKVKSGYKKVKKRYNMDISNEGDVWVSKGFKVVKEGHIKI